MSVIFPSLAPTKTVRESAVITPPRTLIATLFSLCAVGLPQTHPARISTSRLLDLMATLGTDTAAARAAVTRLNRNGFLMVQKEGRRTYQVPAPHALDVLLEGNDRLGGQTRASVHDGWFLMVFSVPESEREKRHSLRTLLVRLGFGLITSAVWIAPLRMRLEAMRALARADLASFVEPFEVRSIDRAASKIGRWWDLETIGSLYSSFVSRWSSADLTALRQAPAVEKFKTYVLVLTDWRKVAYLDPGIPAEYLPPRWPGLEAERLFQKINDGLREDALAFLQEAMEGSGSGSA